MADSKLSRRMLRTSVPLVGLRAAGQGAEFIAWIVLARRLAPHDFGQLSVAFLCCRYAGLVADWGASIRGSRDVARAVGSGVSAALIRRRTSASIALTCIYALAIFLIGQLPLMPLAVVLLNRGLGRDWMALGREKGVRAGFPSLALGLVFLASSLMAKSFSDAAMAVALGYGAGLTVSLALNRIGKSTQSDPKPVDSWILLNTVADQVLITADTLLLAVLRGTRDAGIYAAVYRLPNAWMNLAGLIAAGLVPVVTSAAHASAAQLLAMRRTLIRIGACLGSAVLLSAPVLYFAIPRLFGPGYEEGRVPALLIMVATAALVAYLPLTALHLALGKDRVFAMASLGGAVASVAIDLVAIPMFGMTGAAACAAGVFTILLVVHLRLTRRAVLTPTATS